MDQWTVPLSFDQMEKQKRQNEDMQHKLFISLVWMLWPLWSFPLWACLCVHTKHVTRHKPSCRRMCVINTIHNREREREREREITAKLISTFRDSKENGKKEKKKGVWTTAISEFPSVYPLPSVTFLSFLDGWGSLTLFLSHFWFIYLLFFSFSLGFTSLSAWIRFLSEGSMF